MKRIIALVLLLSVVITPAQAAQKNIAVKKIQQITVGLDAEFLLAVGPSIITISNIDSSTSDISLSASDINGALTWKKSLDSGADEIVMAVSKDSLGNLWLAGMSSPIVLPESATASAIADNPDGVTIESETLLRQDLNRLTIWKLSSEGEIISQYFSEQNAPALINSLAVNSTGLSIVGQFEGRPFIQTMKLSGVFGEKYFIGSSKTILNAVVRNSDGTASVFGSSSETLKGKILAGKRDGVLIKISKSGALLSVIRSSASKAERDWVSADPSYLLTGFVKTGKKIESAITKFSPTFAPSWTLRLASSGESKALTVGKFSYMALSSTSASKNLIGWKPSKPQLLLLTFDSKGIITAAAGSPDLSEPLALSHSKEVGIVGLARSTDGSIAIFRQGA